MNQNICILRPLLNTTRVELLKKKYEINFNIVKQNEQIRS
jgi:hypothetical protein